MSKQREFKSWAHLYDAIAAGIKRHDVREKSANIKVGDVICLRRFDNIKGVYTGESMPIAVTYITDNETPCAFSSHCLDRDYQILSIEVMND